jgi:glycerol dehydrogenase-like iron-containing ADH family enzyme
MPRKLAPENLIPNNLRSKEEVRKNSSKGGKRSVQVRREKKLLSQIYADMLADMFEVETPEGKEKLSGKEYMRRVAAAILARNDSAAVSMLKEIREATEGNKTQITGADGNPIEQSITIKFIDADRPTE